MTGYTKLFGSILQSTIWQESSSTRILWITMLAAANAAGEVESSVPGLARLAGITLAEAEAGLATLTAPDAYSRTKDFEGRRIEAIDGGWVLLNHAKYREKMSKEERKSYLTQKQREWRERQRAEAERVRLSTPVNKRQQKSTLSTQEEEEAHTDEFPEIPSAPAAPEPVAETVKKPRARNVTADALATACGLDPLQMPAPAATTCAVKAAEIKKVCESVDLIEFQRRAANYRTHMGTATLTPAALCQHWAMCDKPKAQQSRHGQTAGRVGEFDGAF